MKKMVFGVVLALAALGLMTAPAMAAPGSQPVAPVLSAADQVFLASLAAPAPAANRPIEKSDALCTATVDCGMTTITCSSDASSTSCSSVDRDCPRTRGSITCGRIAAQCPICPIIQ